MKIDKKWTICFRANEMLKVTAQHNIAHNNSIRSPYVTVDREFCNVLILCWRLHGSVVTKIFQKVWLLFCNSNCNWKMNVIQSIVTLYGKKNWIHTKCVLQNEMYKSERERECAYACVWVNKKHSFFYTFIQILDDLNAAVMCACVCF